MPTGTGPPKSMTQFHSRVPTRITFPTEYQLITTSACTRARGRENGGGPRKKGWSGSARPERDEQGDEGRAEGWNLLFQHGGGGGGASNTREGEESRKKVERKTGPGREWLVAQWVLALILHRIEFIDRMLRRLLRQPLEQPPRFRKFACEASLVIAAGSRGPLLQISAFSPRSFFSSSLALRLPIEAAISFPVRQSNFFRVSTTRGLPTRWHARCCEADLSGRCHVRQLRINSGDVYR